MHLFGRPAPLDELPAGVPVVEDAAQAFGAELGGVRAGAVGVAATFSFFPTKNLFGLGDGGLVASRDAELAERVRLLRFHGSRDKERFEAIGYNSRLDELQAAALRLFLGQWTTGTASGARPPRATRSSGSASSASSRATSPGHVYHMYVVRSPERDRIAAALRRPGIGCATYYTTPLHLQPVYAVARRPAGEPARDRARRPREPRAAALGGDHGGAAGAGRREGPLGLGVGANA